MSAAVGMSEVAVEDEHITKYSDIIKDVFITTPLKSVVVIDNEYPTYSELFANNGTVPNRPRANEANEVIKYFRSKKFICDIENTPADIETDRITNCDLLVLDYHLNEEKKTDDSINIIRQLSENNNNFNTIIIHTATANLSTVWLEIATACSNTRSILLDTISEKDPDRSLKPDFDNFKDEHPYIEVTVDDFVELMNNKVLTREIIRKFSDAKANSSLFAAYELLTFLDKNNLESHDKCLFRQGECRDDSYWMLLDNCFVAICSKGEIQKNNNDFLKELHTALIKWNPSPVKVITTAIQNLIEDSDIFSSDTKLNSNSMSLAISAFLFQYLKNQELSLTNLKYPINLLVEKLSEIFSDFIANNQDLNRLSSEAIMSKLKENAIDLSPRDIVDKVRNNYLSVVSGTPENNNISHDAYFYLNEFMNSCEFNGNHITNGTILFDETNKEYFVVSHASCDLVPRDKSLMGITLIHAISSKKNSLTPKLQIAEQGENIFIQHDDVKVCIQLIDSDNKQPILNTGYLTNKGRITDKKVEIIFTTKLNEHESKHFTIIGQLKEAFADRFLHYTITHTGRVGVDFYNLPK